MKKSTFTIFVGYIWTKTLLNLFTKPYISTREIARRPILIPVLLSPFLSLLILFVAGRIGVFIFNVYGIERSIIATLLSIILIGVVLWQILLLYLFVSFLLLKRYQSK